MSAATTTLAQLQPLVPVEPDLHAAYFSSPPAPKKDTEPEDPWKGLVAAAHGIPRSGLAAALQAELEKQAPQAQQQQPGAEELDLYDDNKTGAFMTLDDALAGAQTQAAAQTADGPRAPSDAFLRGLLFGVEQPAPVAAEGVVVVDEPASVPPPS